MERAEVLETILREGSLCSTKMRLEVIQKKSRCTRPRLNKDRSEGDAGCEEEDGHQEEPVAKNVTEVSKNKIVTQEADNSRTATGKGLIRKETKKRGGKGGQNV